MKALKKREGAGNLEWVELGLREAFARDARGLLSALLHDPLLKIAGADLKAYGGIDVEGRQIQRMIDQMSPPLLTSPPLNPPVSSEPRCVKKRSSVPESLKPAAKRSSEKDSNNPECSGARQGREMSSLSAVPSMATASTPSGINALLLLHLILL